MTSLTGYFNDLMQSRGVTDTLLVSDDAAVLKNRSYAYLPTKPHTKTESPPSNKFADSCANSSSTAPSCPSRKASEDDFLGEQQQQQQKQQRLDCETKFKAVLTSDDIDDLCVNVMRKRRRESFNNGNDRTTINNKESEHEKKSERLSLTSETLENADVVREIVSLASSLLEETTHESSTVKEGKDDDDK